MKVVSIDSRIIRFVLVGLTLVGSFIVAANAQNSGVRASFESAEVVNDAPRIVPPNDAFAASQFISANFGHVLGTNEQATAEAGEPLYNGNNKTVWYSWTAASNVSMTFETRQYGTLTDSVLGIFTGNSVNALTQVATWNDDIDFFVNRHSRITFIANAGTTYRIQVSGISYTEGTFDLDWAVNRAESGKQFNFDGATGSLFSDVGNFRPSNGHWFIRLSGGGYIYYQWGLPTDRLMPGDYDADGGTDLAVWRPASGTFYVLRNFNGAFTALQWGSNGDVPVQGDFDGDDHADFAVWRPSDGNFYVHRSIDNGITVQHWGANGDRVACGDYDGDGKTDFGVVRGESWGLVFYILRSSDGGWSARQFGLPGDSILPGDYDGDGKNDIAVYRPGTNSVFYYLRSSDNGFRAVYWGLGTDIPVVGDHITTTSGVSDICVWRPSNTTLYCYGDGGTGGFYVVQHGTNGDIPISSSNIH